MTTWRDFTDRRPYPTLSVVTASGAVLLLVGLALWSLDPLLGASTGLLGFRIGVLGFLLLAFGVSGYLAIRAFDRAPGG